VEQALAMQLVERARDLSGDRQRFGHGQRALLAQHDGQRVALHVVAEQPELVANLTTVDDAYQRVVGERGLLA
jgi:hypothetical protein